MKLQTKLALYNTISKIIIILGFAALIPSMVKEVAVNHIDKRLLAKQNKIMKIVQRGDIREIKDDEDCSFGNFNLLKEEFVSIEPAEHVTDTIFIQNDKRDVGGEIFEFRILSSAFRYDNQPYTLEIGEGLSSIKELNSTLQNITLLVMFIVSLITFLADISFSRYLLRPFNRIIIEKLRNTNHPTSFDFKTINTSTDDFKYLDQSINEMMHKVQEAFLIEKEFMANVSHELLTPISILKSRFENILSESKVPPDVEQKILDSLKTISRLSKIIKTLLMISNIENDQYLKEDRVSLQSFIREVLEEIGDRSSEKEIKITSVWKSDFTLERCNRTLLFMLFFNIINNAIKYNKQKGEITITGKNVLDKFVVEIADSGIGIGSDALKYIFERFKRFKNIANESYGLGLPIVKTIADFHDIKLEVTSLEGHGTNFKLFF